MKPVNDHCCNADDPNVCRGQYVATEQNGVGLGGKLGRPRFREFPPRPIPNEHFPAFAPDPRSLLVSPLIWKKIVAFSKQIQGWKCKLMIWSFNHSGANPDAEEFPADSGSSDFTNPRQQPLKPLLLLHPSNPPVLWMGGQLVPQVNWSLKSGFKSPRKQCLSFPLNWLL